MDVGAQHDEPHGDQIPEAYACRCIAPRAGIDRLGREPANQGRTTQQNQGAHDERGTEPDARGDERARERTDDLPDRHAGLNRRDLTADGEGISRPAGHHECERRRRPHDAEDEAREKEAGQRRGHHHPEEGDALKHLDGHVQASGSTVFGVAPPQRRRQHGDQRRDAENPAGPTQRRCRVPMSDGLDVERQAHEDERPREGAQEHRERNDVVLQAVTTGVPRNRNGAASFVVILSKPEKQDAVRRRARERRRTALFAADSGISGRRGTQLQRPSRGKKSRN